MKSSSTVSYQVRHCSPFHLCAKKQDERVDSVLPNAALPCSPLIPACRWFIASRYPKFENKIVIPAKGKHILGFSSITITVPLFAPHYLPYGIFAAETSKRTPSLPKMQGAHRYAGYHISRSRRAVDLSNTEFYNLC